MNKIKGLILLTVILFSASASADFYRFRDKDGNIVYTDDITKVPRDQQPGVRRYKDQGTGAERIEPKRPKEAEQISATAKTQEKTLKTAAETDEILMGLDIKKKVLDLEYQALMKEKKVFDGKKTFKDKKEAVEHNKRVSGLNERIDRYERKKAAFNAEVAEYNIRVRKEMEALLESKQKKK